MAYYNELNTHDLINSPQYSEIFNDWYTIEGHEPTEEELMDIGVYVYDGILVKYYNMSIDGNATSVQWRMTVQQIEGTNDYRVKPRGVAIDTDLDSFITSVSAGFGYEINNSTVEDIKSKILDVAGEFNDIDPRNLIINGIIDIYGRTSYDYNIVDVIQNYFERFPNIDNPYVLIQRPLPTGENTVTDFDHSDFINNNVASNNNGVLTTSYTPKQLKALLDSVYDSSDEFKDMLSNSQIVRFAYRQVAPYILTIYANGYRISNSTIVVGNETENNQRYSAFIEHVKGFRIESNYSTYGDYNLHIAGQWDVDISRSDTFYNYVKSESVNTYGLTYGAGNICTIIDSVGTAVAKTPVQSITNNHNPWYDPNGYVPVGHKPYDPTVPSIDVQAIVRKGEPPVVVTPKPVRGELPVPKIDDPSPSTISPVPSDDIGGANIYHPTQWEMNSFYGWLWDRDTWTDKQNMNSNPSECIISYHTLPLPDDLSWFSSTKQSLVLGYLHAKTEGHYEAEGSEHDITSFTVPNRYVEYNFGRVTIPRTYKDYRDFDREIYIFLPYLGFRQLRCDDVTAYKSYMSVDVYLSYKIDIATGDFVAEISINKNVADKKVLYTFNGNMATEKPISATDKTRLAQARWSTLGGLGTTLLGTGLATAGGLTGNLALTYTGLSAMVGGATTMFGGASNAANQNVVSVDRSGNLAGNFGAMGGKTPYIVINALIPFDTNYAPYSGDSTNVTVQIGQLSGFTRCKYVHVDTLASATTQEKEAIERMLLEGVIL